MASSATVLTWLQIFNQFNIKWTYIGTIAIFMASSAVCDAANSMNMLIGCRVICGVGGVGQYVGVSFLPRLTTMQERRPLYVSGIGLTWGAGTVLGPIIGGAFTDSAAGWRWFFYINLCVGGLFAPCLCLLAPFCPASSRGKALEGSVQAYRYRWDHHPHGSVFCWSNWHPFRRRHVPVEHPGHHCSSRDRRCPVYRTWHPANLLHSDHRGNTPVPRGTSNLASAVSESAIPM